MPDRNRPLPRICAAGVPLAPHDLPSARARGAAAQRRHYPGQVVELTGSRRALSRGGFSLHDGQSEGHRQELSSALKRNLSQSTDGEGAIAWLGAALVMATAFACAWWLP